MDGTVVAIGVVVLAVVVTIITVTAAGNSRRRRALRELSHHHGWQWLNRHDSLPATCPPGPPFRELPRRAKTRNVVTGQYRDRQFAAFEYWYVTSTQSGQYASTKTHYYAVWRISLPARLPSVSLGAEGVLGGKVAHAFGFRRMNTGNDEFDRQFRVKCDDQAFGARLLYPAMVNLLLSTGVWAWRVDGNVMLSYTEGRLHADDVLPRLDLMSRVLDHVPREIWEQYRRSPA